MSKNLKPINEKENFKELSRKGGISSGKARRKKANLKKAMEVLLSSEMVSPKNQEQLKVQGLEINNESLLVFSIFQKAVSGNQKAVENILKLIGVKDKYDIAEQKARIKSLSKENNSENIEVVFLNEDNIPD